MGSISELALTGKLGEIRKSLFSRGNSGSFPVFPEQFSNGTIETTENRFYSVHYLGEALNRLKGWSKDLNSDYLGLASIFGIQNLSVEAIKKYHIMTNEQRRKFIETLANSNSLDPRTVALVGIADDATVPFLAERPADSLPKYHTFCYRYLNNPDSPVKSEEVIDVVKGFGAELFVLYKPESLSAETLVGLA